ncbi:MAG: endonuclease/exonuclease/phosphatase family protein [Clostridia bacterium]|nr:endonuclease/exonuclease/phosphatase family protein [Clostridia bacterium]
MDLKIGTYNICHCGNFEKRKQSGKDFVVKVDIEKTASAIKGLGLDVIGLNEVFDDGEKEEYLKQTEKLARLAGYEYFEFALGEKFSWTTIGNAVLSHYPIIGVEKIIVKKPEEKDRNIEGALWWEDRVLLIVDILVDKKPIRVIESHFGLNLLEQQNIVKKVCKVIDESKYPVVLMGDFNVLPNDQVLNDIYKRLKSVAKETGNKEFTFSSYNPEKQIDYIFVSKSVKIKSCTVHDILTSDHRPLTAEVEV